ncbi:hypothetical protein EFA69_14665 [Rufibacter immobilis]|uniref:Uncharacterized protein n=1 Tax=Rufibacter immobilis TaxID=1348778 RepID=A0A3M9MPD9_9BACT|nr:hypothetical protein EFA69_14665 [Rufibacter immobilis]
MSYTWDMAFLLEYFREIDISRLTHQEAKQCLYYLNLIQLSNQAYEAEGAPIREKVIERLKELENQQQKS